MLFRNDPFGLQLPTVVMHRRRSSRAVASIPFESNSDLPALAVRSRARVTTRRGLGKLLSFHTWARVFGFGRTESVGTLPRRPHNGPRAA
jgi:hypothetical protein